MRPGRCWTCAPATAAWPCWRRSPGPKSTVDAADISAGALEVARINVDRHGLADRIRLVAVRRAASRSRARYDLILCNPPYVNADSMARLPRRIPGRAGAGAGRRRGRHGFRTRAAARGAPHLSDARRAGAGDRQRARPFRGCLSRAWKPSGWKPAPAKTRSAAHPEKPRGRRARAMTGRPPRIRRSRTIGE